MKILVSLLCIMFYGLAMAQDGAYMAGEEVTEEYPYVLPFLGQKAIDAGEEIPLPVGVSVAYYYVSRDIDVKNVSASLNDNPLQSVDDLVNFEVGTKVHTGTIRADVWILPFLNLYGIYGTIDNSSSIKANFTVGTNDVSLVADGGFNGTTAGVGAVLAAGYNNFFLTLDANKVFSELGAAFKTKFEGEIYNARAGWKGKINSHNTRIWLGATYWDTERTMSGSIGETPTKINFEVVQKPVNPGNLSLGFNYEFTRRLNIVMDYGFNFDDANIFLLSMNYRFP